MTTPSTTTEPKPLAEEDLLGSSLLLASRPIAGKGCLELRAVVGYPNKQGPLNGNLGMVYQVRLKGSGEGSVLFQSILLEPTIDAYNRQ